MGARPRLPPLRDRAGLGAALADGARARRADLRTVALATGLGAASSSCSYAAVAIAKSMFQKGASLATAMVFQFASTNLVFEIGIVMWIFLGWQFTLAEFVGGIVLIALMWLGVRLFITRRLEAEARAHAEAAQAGHQHSSAGSEGLSFKERLTSVAPGRTSRTTSAATGRCSGRRSPAAS